MKRSIIIYGIIAGLIVIVTMTIGIEAGNSSIWLGYLVMLIAFSTIYVAVKQYRDDTLGGVISFSTGLLLGLGISAVAGVVYVAVWEAYLAATDYKYVDDYTSSIIEARTLAGASETELLAAAAEMEKYKNQYANPLVRLPITFLEIFPVGFLVSLVSAAALRNNSSTN